MADTRRCRWCNVVLDALFCSVQCSRRDLEARRAWPIGYCPQCGNVVSKRHRPRQVYCSRACSAAAPPLPDDSSPTCLVCGVAAERRSDYCNGCGLADLTLKQWQQGADGGTQTGLLQAQLRRWFVRQHPECAGCGRAEWSNSWYTGPIPLQLDHIDGNSTRNTMSNVRMLCPTCHATTPTYGSKNRGEGRSMQQAERIEAQLRGETECQ